MKIEAVIGGEFVRSKKGRRFDAEKDAGKLISHSCVLAYLEKVIRGMMLMEIFGLRKKNIALSLFVDSDWLLNVQM